MPALSFIPSMNPTITNILSRLNFLHTKGIAPNDGNSRSLKCVSPEVTWWSILFVRSSKYAWWWGCKLTLIKEVLHAYTPNTFFNSIHNVATNIYRLIFYLAKVRTMSIKCRVSKFSHFFTYWLYLWVTCEVSPLSLTIIMFAQSNYSSTSSTLTCDPKPSHVRTNHLPVWYLATCKHVMMSRRCKSKIRINKIDKHTTNLPVKHRFPYKTKFLK